MCILEDFKKEIINLNVGEISWYYNIKTKNNYLGNLMAKEIYKIDYYDIIWSKIYMIDIEKEKIDILFTNLTFDFELNIFILNISKIKDEFLKFKIYYNGR